MTTIHKIINNSLFLSLNLSQSLSLTYQFSPLFNCSLNKFSLIPPLNHYYHYVKFKFRILSFQDQSQVIKENMYVNKKKFTQTQT